MAKKIVKKEIGGTIPKNKTVRLREDSKNYLTKIKTDDKKERYMLMKYGSCFFTF